MNNKALIIICFLIGYSILSAKSPKKFTDTVVFKNGTTLNGIKATDSVLVTTEDGTTTIYKKKDISEIQKGGVTKESNLESEKNKKENKQEIAIDKQEKNLIVERWSDYQGAMRWDEAIEYCLNKAMRLPTIAELRTAYVTGTTESWKKDGLFYWSATRGEKYSSYNIGIANGHYFNDDITFINDVRCIR